MSSLCSLEALEEDTSLVLLIFFLFTIFLACLISLVPACISVLQKNRSYNMYIEKRFIVRNWLMWLWRLTNPSNCRLSQHTGDSGEQTVYFQSELKPQNQNWRCTASLKAGRQETQEKPLCQLLWRQKKSWCPSSKTVRPEEAALTREHQPFVLVRPSTGCMRPTHLKKGNLIYCLPM